MQSHRQRPTFINQSLTYSGYSWTSYLWGGGGNCSFFSSFGGSGFLGYYFLGSYFFAGSDFLGYYFLGASCFFGSYFFGYYFLGSYFLPGYCFFGSSFLGSSFFGAYCFLGYYFGAGGGAFGGIKS